MGNDFISYISAVTEVSLVDITKYILSIVNIIYTEEKSN